MHEQIDVDLRLNQFRPPRFVQRALGKSFGGETLQPAKLAVALWGEIDLLGSVALDGIRKVLGKVKVEPYESVAEDLLGVFESEVDPSMDDIRRYGGESLAKVSGNTGDDWFYPKANVVRAAWKMEIKLMGAEIMESGRSAKPQVTSFTIQNSNVGVIQTGDGSSVVGTTLKFTHAEKEELGKALGELRDRLEKVESLSDVARVELCEVTVDVDTELAKPKPNSTKVRGLLSMILAGIKGIGNLVDIYNVVEKVLQSHGVHLLG